MEEVLIEDEDNDARSESVKSDNDLLEYMYTIPSYSFQNKKIGKKIVKLYKNALKAGKDEFLYLVEETNVHLFTDKEVWYKQTIDKENATFLYYGDINEKGNPDGLGIVLRNWNKDIPEWALLYSQINYTEDTYAEAVYIGEFKDGFKDGYGMNFERSGVYDMPIMIYEGEFDHGQKDGTGIEYNSGLAESFYIENFDDKLLDCYYEECIDKLSGEIMFSDFIRTSVCYEGSYKDDKRNGKGVEYYINENYNMESCIKYKGEFKSDKYSGNGELYYSDGTLCYEGEFYVGKFNGKGTLYDENGVLQYKGNFEDNEIQ